jgi:DNA modification methylase
VTVQIIIGDARERLKDLPDGSVHCCVTSPPYFGLRDYGVDGQMGLEATPDEFVAGLITLFREVRRVLRDDGTLWLNLGDSYTGSGKGGNPEAGKQATNKGSQSVGVLYGKTGETARRAAVTNVTRKDFDLGPKQLLGIPWRVAFALQADGWWLRQDIIWSKPNPMPESVRDRCTKAHEYLFLLSKGPRYHYDADAIAEPVTLSTVARLSQNVEAQAGSERVPGKTNGTMKAVGRGGKNAFRGQGSNRDSERGVANRDGRDMRDIGASDTRNKRSVWDVATQPFSGAHFATFPPALIEPCILAGCPKGGTVLDPFGGAGTTGLVADRLGRDAILIELNPEYADLARDRLRSELCRVESEAPEREHDAGPLFGRPA